MAEAAAVPEQPTARPPGASRVPKAARMGLTAAAIAAAIIIPLFIDSGGNVMNNLVLAAAYVVMALGLNIIVGFAGLLDLGYVAFFAIGAYTMGYFGSLFHITANGGKGVHILVSGPAANLPGIHLNFLIIIVLAIVATTCAGMVIGLPTLRLRGDYIAIVTLAFGEIVGRIAINGDEIKGFGTQLTAGRQGITPVDKIQLPFLDTFNSLELRPWYWVAFALVLVALFVNFRLRDSRLGRA